MPKNADKEQTQVANELKDIGKGKMPNEKMFFKECKINYQCKRKKS